MDVVGLGTFAMDVLMKVDTLPKEDAFCVVEETTYLPGGSGTNVIVQLARLGADCGYIGKIASDEVGKGILNSLKEEHVDVSKMVVTPTGLSLHTNIVVDRTGNKFIMLNMGDAALTLTKEEIDLSYISDASVFYTDLFPMEPAAAGIRSAKAAGKKTVFNMQTGLDTMEGLGISKKDILGVLEDVDIFAPCRGGLYALTGTEDLNKCKNYLRRYCKGILIFTLGKEGVIAFDETDKQYSAGSYPVKAIDTTGAGDSFMGAFIYIYLLQNRGMQEALEFASACAAYTCTGLGARFSPSKEQAEAFGRELSNN